LNPDGKKKPLYTGTKVGFSSFMTHDEKTYQFIDDVIREVSQISPSKYFHIGGDEAESTKKADYDYFVGRVSEIVKKYGKTPVGWDPIDTASEINSSVVLQNWKDSNEAARKKNMKMIISIAKKAYLDMKYNESTPYGLDWAGYIPVETAYKWDPTDFAPKELVLGIEAPLWTETIADAKAMDYMIYPRLLGYAEIGWTLKDARDWGEYKSRLKKQGERMKNQGINYYNDSTI
ncbi:MAG: family 20 glycosylhydrolase, partial [Clostridiaceae bacterium]